MSVDYSAHAIIGVEIAVEKLYREERKRSCNHPLPNDAAYCPTCGKAAYRIDAAPIYDDNRDLLGGLKVVFGTDRAFAVIGLAHLEARDEGRPAHIDLPQDLTEVYETIERVLRHYGLWGEQSIELYSILDCSY